MDRDHIENIYFMSELKKHAKVLKKQINNLSLRGDEVLNGIAFDVNSRELYLTGKDWNIIYNVEFL